MNWDGTVHPLTTLFPQIQPPADWCSGCGLGIVWQALLRAISTLKDPRGQSDVDDCQLLISGLGCLGLINKLSPLQVNQASPEKLGEQAFKIAQHNQPKKVVILASEPDILVGGIKALLPANINLSNKDLEGTVLTLFINSGLSLVYSISKGPVPLAHLPPSEQKMLVNLPWRARQQGVEAVSRWTSLHVRRLTRAIKLALTKAKGFYLIEVISPCLMIWADRKKLGESLPRMNWLQRMAVINLAASVTEMDLSSGERFVIGHVRQDGD